MCIRNEITLQELNTVGRRLNLGLVTFVLLSTTVHAVQLEAMHRHKQMREVFLRELHHQRKIQKS